MKIAFTLMMIAFAQVALGATSTQTPTHRHEGHPCRIIGPAGPGLVSIEYTQPRTLKTEGGGREVVTWNLADRCEVKSLGSLTPKDIAHQIEVASGKSEAHGEKVKAPSPSTIQTASKETSSGAR